MKINIVTTTAFHLHHLARLGPDHGLDLTLWCTMPKFKARSYGIDRRRIQSGFTATLPWSALAQQKALASVRRNATYEMLSLADQWAAKKMSPAEVFIGLSSVSIDSARRAREQFDSTVIIDRGAQHVLQQERVLLQSGATKLPRAYVQRELDSYDQAEIIAIPSSHVLRSFLREGFTRDHLFVNPYGVDTTLFRNSPKKRFTSKACFVGGWTYQKGADVLSRVLHSARDLRLDHFGMPGDVPFPSSDRFRSRGHTPQKDLANELPKYPVLILPSIQDGFGMVLLEAYAAGCRIVATERTGGPDMCNLVSAPDRISIVDPGDHKQLSEAIAFQLAASRDEDALCGYDLNSSEVKDLSWRGYTERYVDLIDRRHGGRPTNTGDLQ